ncbi:MAG TPA: folate-binding protein [Mariprofundaceae bacterium]|nr:folate-binding protein [Mariprofundaceae bacterium]
MSVSIPSIMPQTADLLLHSYCLGGRSNWTVLKASGPTIRDYLQGQITQDIRRLTATQAIHTAVLSPQGKAVGELYILQGRDDELVMLSPSASAVDVVARLRQFAIGHEVRIGIVEQLSVCSLQGANAVEGLKLFGLPEPGDRRLAASRRDDADCFALTSPADPRGFWVVADSEQIRQQLAASPRTIGEDQVEAMRIIRGLIRFGEEWDAALSPMNANLVEFDAVSFDKGCYVGQEVTSRMHWRGGVKKKLYRLRLAKAPSSLPAPIQTDVAIGELRAAANDPGGQCFGIGLLPIETVESGKSLQLADGSVVQVLEPCHA